MKRCRRLVPIGDYGEKIRFVSWCLMGAQTLSNTLTVLAKPASSFLYILYSMEGKRMDTVAIADGRGSAKIQHTLMTVG